MPHVPGHRWKRRRAGLRLSQGVAAEALGISKRTLQNIETNPKHRVSLDVVFGAESVYEVSADWLLGKGDDDEPTEKPTEEPARREPSGDPSGPPPRRDDRSGRGPRRDVMKQAS